MAIEGPGHDRDVDEEFARIVAGWNDVATTSGSAALPAPTGMPAAPEEESPREGLSSGQGAADDDASPEPAPPPAPPEPREPPAPAAPLEPADRPQGEEPDRSASRVDAAAAPAAPDPFSFGVVNDPPVADEARADGPMAVEEGSDQHEPGWRGYLPDDADEHFEPPEPQLPPAHDATYWLAVVGLVAGPLLVLWAVVLSGDPDPGWLIVAGLLLTVGGFGLLIMRGSGERDPDDDGSRV